MMTLLTVFLILDMQLLPPWELRRCPTEQYACYDFAKAKRLMQLDAELQLRLLDCDICEKTLLEQKHINSAQEEIIKKLEESLETTTHLYNARKAQADKLMGDVQRLERYNVFGKALPWVVVALVTSMTGGFILGWLLHP